MPKMQEKNKKIVISNSSCLIILKRIGKIELLSDLYTRIIIPPAVEHEVFEFESKPKWIETVEIKQSLVTKILEKTLGKGESEAINLCLELNAHLLIIDDLAARRTAYGLGIKFTGVMGILLEAKRVGLIEEIKGFLDEMRKYDFRVSKTIYDSVLKIAKEKI
ncbi:MAG: DUF3368 domain-containing protein [bacterium]